MKNKEWTKRVEQLNFDVRNCETNVKSLSNDIVRVERLFSELWTFVYKNKEELAQKPELQTIRCDECGNYSKDYQIFTEDGYFTEVICKNCLKEREKSDD